MLHFGFKILAGVGAGVGFRVVSEVEHNALQHPLTCCLMSPKRDLLTTQVLTSATFFPTHHPAYHSTSATFFPTHHTCKDSTDD